MTNTTCTASAPAALTVGSLVTLNGDTYRVESIDRPAAVAAELERSGFDGNNYLASRVLKPGQRAARVAMFYRSAATGAPTVASIARVRLRRWRASPTPRSTSAIRASLARERPARWRWVNNVTLAVPGGLGAAGWAAVLSCDPGLADALRADDPRAAGEVVIASLTRAAEPCPDPLAVVLAVAEAARLGALAGRHTPRHARQLAVPCAVEVACWCPATSLDQSGRSYPTGGFAASNPADLAGRLASLQTVREREFRNSRYHPQPVIPTGEVLPAVRLIGGLAGRVVLREQLGAGVRDGAHHGRQHEGLAFRLQAGD